MKNPLTRTGLILGALPLLFSFQTIGPAPQEKNDDGTWPVIEGADKMAPADEMTELFRLVETRLKEIDRLLSDAGAGDTSALSGVKEAGIDDLLKATGESSREVVKNIDRILEIASQSGGGT